MFLQDQEYGVNTMLADLASVVDKGWNAIKKYEEKAVAFISRKFYTFDERIPVFDMCVKLS